MDFHDPNLVFYADLAKHDGAAFMSDDAYGHLCTVTTATWTLDGRDFNSASPDYIEIPASSTQLNFTSGDFSMVARINIDDLTALRWVFTRGITGVDGWAFFVRNTGTIEFRTNQTAGGAFQTTTSTAGDITTGSWFTIGFSRSGAVAKVYKNGVDVTNVSGTHVNPLTSARTAKIGIDDDKLASPYDGKMEYLMVYNRALSELEHMNIYQATK